MITRAKIFWISLFPTIISYLIFLNTNNRIYYLPMIFFLLSWLVVIKLESVEIFPEKIISRLIIKKGQIRYRIGSDAYFFRAGLSSKSYIKKITKDEMKELSKNFNNDNEQIHEYLIKNYNAKVLMPREHIKKFGYHFDFSFA